ncbi:glutathione S-transferase family protein [Sphingobium phenoxybenzoativorans]|uniref:Glutathione S-transferase family protein n=1 Tax=Sphingobium phenoxybenzoativorans TaxID=1592790 RepID=A0A975K6V2_9SPHN|nr:glutathione S-transferase family protein [Sphingobium phenoxybenzoativorans]QUT05855.1 glutathione S-transferase family protein [Sphingobium phenoxybenzoativorans]
MAGLTLFYHPLSSYCWKVLIAFYENGTAFTPYQVDHDRPESGAALRAAWPMERFPVLRDDSHDVTLPESSAIIEYLSVRYPGGFAAIPAGFDDAMEARVMDRLFDNHVMTGMQTVVFNSLRPEDAKDEYGADQARAMLRKTYAMLEERIAGRTWAAGEAFTLADCAAMPSLWYADKVAPFRGDHPVLAAYLDRLEARPSVQRVLKEAEPYFALFPG